MKILQKMPLKIFLNWIQGTKLFNMSLEDRVRRKVIAAKAENFRTLNLSGSPGSENQLETLPEEVSPRICSPPPFPISISTFK